MATTRGCFLIDNILEESPILVKGAEDTASEGKRSTPYSGEDDPCSSSPFGENPEESEKEEEEVNEKEDSQSNLHRIISNIMEQRQKNVPEIRPGVSMVPFPRPLLPPGIPSPMNDYFTKMQLMQQAINWSHAIAAMHRPPMVMQNAMRRAKDSFVPSPMRTIPLISRPRLDQSTRGNVKKYRCDICDKTFSRSNTLITHKRIHTGEKPFKCDHCGRAFRQPGNLTRHRLTHTTVGSTTNAVKPYVCNECDKAFNRASNLHTHMRTHVRT